MAQNPGRVNHRNTGGPYWARPVNRSLPLSILVLTIGSGRPIHTLVNPPTFRLDEKLHRLTLIPAGPQKHVAAIAFNLGWIGAAQGIGRFRNPISELLPTLRNTLTG